MKKILLLCSLLLLITGCGKSSDEKILKTFTKKINNSDAYTLKGSMEIFNDEDTYTYALAVYYKKPDLYKVVLINQNNNHEQVILKNTEGVYVVTPSLNKSFKFQSEWPSNSSQAYLLQSLVKDLDRGDVTTRQDGDDYIVTSSVDYPNNDELKTEEIYINKDGIASKVTVLNAEGQTKIKVIFKDVDLKAKIDEDEFKLSSIIDEDCCSTNESGKMEDIIYPLYIPSNTYLSLKETIDTDTGNRNILTFNGDKNFTLIEEKAVAKNELEIIPVYGEPLFINDSIGAISANSLYWHSDNIDYYLTGKDLSNYDLLTIANSVGNTISVGK